MSSNDEYVNHLEQEALLDRLYNLEIEPDADQQWLVVIYFLVDGIVNGVHGAIYPVSVHRRKAKADEAAAKLVEKHSVSFVRVYPMCEWRQLTNREQPDSVRSYVKDEEREMYRKRVERYKETRERRRRINEDLIKQREPGTIEHYASTWLHISKRDLEIANLRSQLAILERDQAEDITDLRREYESHPDYEAREPRENGEPGEARWALVAKDLLCPLGGKDELDGLLAHQIDMREAVLKDLLDR